MSQELAASGDTPPGQENRPWPWVIGCVNFFNTLRKFWVRLIGQKPSFIPYIGYGNSHQVRILARAIYAAKREIKDPGRVRGWRSFMAVPHRNADVLLDIGGQTFPLISDDGGIIDQRIRLSLPVGWHTGVLSYPGQDQQVEVSVTIIDDSVDFGVVSDIDDTVMVTTLGQPLIAGWNTFVTQEESRDAVSGMPVLYERINKQYPNSPFLYLSTGAWNIAPTLSRFMSRNMFPRGPLLLTDWGTTRERWFRNGREHKTRNLESLIRDFPNTRWLFIGDDGENDPQIYHDIAVRFPDHVYAIAIRKLGWDAVEWENPPATIEEASEITNDPHLVDPPVTWIFAHDGSGIARQLHNLKLLK